MGGNYGNSLSRSFGKNSVKVTFLETRLKSWFDEIFFRIERISRFSTQGGNYGNLLSLFFGKKFVKVMVLLIYLLSSWFDEIFSVRVFFFIFLQIAVSQCGKTRNSLSNQKMIRENISLVISLIQLLLSRNFCHKSMTISEIYNTVCVRENYYAFIPIISWNQ